MKLLEQQWLFGELVPHLLLKIKELGYKYTWGEAWRPPETAKLYAQQGLGTVTSLHIDRLAVDLNLFKDGKYITDGTGHTDLGAFWKSLHPLCRWGGDFPKKDFNHYSMEWGGRK